MDQTPFANMAQNFGSAFGVGIQSSITSMLSSVAAPLMACVTLWIIIQGVLVTRGDIDARGGITRIVKIAFIIGILTSSGLYTTYVQTLFMTVVLTGSPLLPAARPRRSTPLQPRSTICGR